MRGHGTAVFYLGSSRARIEAGLVDEGVEEQGKDPEWVRKDMQAGKRASTGTVDAGEGRG